MGRDKAMLPVNGQNMSLVLAEKYKILGPVFFSVDRKGRFPAGEYAELEDHFPGCGPLNGIVSAFIDTKEDVVFLTATDMPGGSTDVVKRLMLQLGDYDACILRNEPLFGVYRRSCLAAAMDCLQNGEHSMRGFLSRVRVKELEPDHKDIVMNLNTPEEFCHFLEKEHEFL